ncbi:M14 family zinc carboxypeptidase [Sphingobacterium bovistauri]|uniref:Peptidase M14 n=1 Tax=Sphingobacterium bovistauri TaxID=2781959 RepID=A0ABS7Z7B9_9SPHI|nr:M14 family zinc carboxypeptidase [Sphingobacterium bovistauri]MCA5004604.1 peptidase M14 [Sphingobacterium bovistauri]
MKKLILLLSIMGSLHACDQSHDTTVGYSNAMKIDTTTFNTIYSQYKEPALQHRRFKPKDVDSLLQLHKQKAVLDIVQIGKSFEGRAIYEASYGNGSKRVMLWSQMHGDEPTATMALFDLFNFLEGSQDGHDTIRDLLKSKLNIHFIPMLNPDGAERYQRRTAQGIDMNRDARAGHTVEGALLRARARVINPQYGFNLHDQNIYYNVPGTKNPVSISLLAPAFNESREINPVRENAMKIAAGMNDILQKYIPDAVAKYDDTYTPRGFGDNFQSWDASTVLIESGGMKGDPEKQQIRKLNFIIILNSLIQIAEGSYAQFNKQQYEDIPFNASQLHDVVIRNITVGTDSNSFKTDLAIRRNEMTVGRDYFVRGKVEDIGDLKESFGYDEVDADGLKLIAGKVDSLGIKSINDLTTAQAYDLLKNGVMAVKIKEVGETKEKSLHTFPVHLFTQSRFYMPITADFGGMANFYIGDSNGNLKYAILNGYLIGLSEEIDNSSIQLKNRVH